MIPGLAGPADLLDLLVRSLALVVLFAVVFLLPGRTLAERLAPDRPAAERNALAWALGPWAVGAAAWTVGGLTGWFLSLPLVGAAGLAAAACFPRELRAVGRRVRAARAGAYRAVGLRDRRGEPDPDEADGFPPLLAAAILGYFLLKFDANYVSALGVHEGIFHAVGLPLEGGTPARNGGMGLALPRPLGLVAAPAALAGAFEVVGLRAWLAATMLALALVTRAALRRLELGPRAASLGGALAAWNPWTLSVNHLEAMDNVVPALWLGVVALLGAGRGRPLPAAALGLAAAALVSVRPAAALGLPFLAVLLGRGAVRAFLLGAAAPLLWLLGHRWASGTPLLSDPGLLPGSLAEADRSWWWTSGLQLRRMPYAAFPSWLALPLVVGRQWGTVLLAAAGLGVLGALRARADWLKAASAAAGLPTLAVLLLAPVLQGRQFERGAVWIVPTVLALALGLRTLHGDATKRRLRRPAAVLAAAALLSLLGLGLRGLDLPLEPRAYASFPHLLPEPEPWRATERRRAAALPPWPAYAPDHLADPFLAGQGRRYRDLIAALRRPGWEHRYVSMDEKVLRFHKAKRFAGRLPRHPVPRPEAQLRGPGDPYLERAPMTVAIDLRAALEDQVFWVDCRRETREDVVADLASEPGPLRLDLVPGPGRAAVAVHVFKEYYGPEEAELALVVMPPDWSEAPPPSGPRLLQDGVLRLLVPGRSFLSYAQVLGEGHESMELLVGIEWHAALRCEQGPLRFGPFRL